MSNVTNDLANSAETADVNEQVYDTPEGITAPPIDELLTKVSSKYALVIFAAKRARQINSYYQEQDLSLIHISEPTRRS